VLYVINTLLSGGITIIFTEFFVRGSPRLRQRADAAATPATAVTQDAAELAVMIYHIGAICRELFQIAKVIGFEGAILGLWSYISDPWNFMDFLAIVTFMSGFAGKHYDINLPVQSDDDECFMKLGTICLGSSLGPSIFGYAWAPFVWEVHTGELLYGISLFFMYIRLLRSFALIPRINVIVKIFIKMLKDVCRFMVMYIIFLFAFSTLMVGAGGPLGAIDKCYAAGLAVSEGGDRRRGSSGGASTGSNATLDGAGEGEFSRPGPLGGGAAGAKRVPADQEDYEFVTCWPSWWFFRTVFQAFGEFHLDEMSNDWSILIVIVVFFLMNIVLMNLLVAM